LGFEKVEKEIERIVSSRPDLTRDYILDLIERKVNEARGFLTRESAVRIVAVELGVDYAGLLFKGDIPIKSLLSGLGDVTVVGRIIAVYPLQKFTRPDETEGRVRRLLIVDKTGEARVTLWDNNAEVFSADGLIGKVVRFCHGYVRTGLDGKLELNIGSRGKLEMSPPDVSEEEFPSITKFIKRVNEISGKEKTVNVVGVVRQIYPTFTFKREDGSEGKLRRIELENAEAKAVVILWNEKVDELVDIVTGRCLEIFNAKVKESIKGELELHIDQSTDVLTLTKVPEEFNITRFVGKKEDL
jgi:replication factor A1